MLQFCKVAVALRLALAAAHAVAARFGRRCLRLGIKLSGYQAPGQVNANQIFPSMSRYARRKEAF